MITVDQAVAELVQDCAAQTELHTRFAVRLQALTQLACSHVSAHDVGIALLDELGDEAKVAAVLGRNAEEISRNFNQWHAAARLAAHERRQMK